MISMKEIEEIEKFEGALKQPMEGEQVQVEKAQKQFPADQLSDEWF